MNQNVYVAICVVLGSLFMIWLIRSQYRQRKCIAEIKEILGCYDRIRALLHWDKSRIVYTIQSPFHRVEIADKVEHIVKYLNTHNFKGMDGAQDRLKELLNLVNTLPLAIGIDPGQKPSKKELDASVRIACIMLSFSGDKLVLISYISQGQ